MRTQSQRADRDWRTAIVARLWFALPLLLFGCVFPTHDTPGSHGLPDFRVAALEWGPAFCVSAVIRNMGTAAKPAGRRISYRIEATYTQPERSRTLSGVDEFLSQRELPAGWEAPTWICDLSGEAINAYRPGRIRLTVNTEQAVPELSMANNARETDSPQWNGSDVQILGGSMLPLESSPSQPVRARLRMKNIGNEPTSEGLSFVMIVQARGAFPQPMRYEIPSSTHINLQPHEERSVEVSLSPPLPVAAHLPPGFFTCVWTLAQLAHTGYAVFINPPNYAGRLAPGGPPAPDRDTDSEHCWTVVNTHAVPEP